MTAQANQIRGLLGEYGIVGPQGISHVARCIPEILEDAENDLPGVFRLVDGNDEATAHERGCGSSSE